MRIYNLTPEQREDPDYLNNLKYPVVIFSPKESGVMEDLDRALAFHALELVLQGTDSSDQPCTIEPNF